MRIYTYEGVKIVHISEFARATRHSVSVIRGYLNISVSEAQNVAQAKRRRLKHFRDGCTIWIPYKEIFGYPFINHSVVYHYDEEGNRYVCDECTFGKGICKLNADAQSEQTEY